MCKNAIKTQKIIQFSAFLRENYQLLHNWSVKQNNPNKISVIKNCNEFFLHLKLSKETNIIII